MDAVHFICRDCSSIGQSTALSRRKLRVRAPSVPTDPNPIKKIDQYILPFSVKLGTNGRISCLMVSFSFFFFFSILFRLFVWFICKPFVNNGSGKRLGGYTRKAVGYGKDRMEKNDK